MGMTDIENLLNVNMSERGTNKGFTYMKLKTWSGSAKVREVGTHGFIWDNEPNQYGEYKNMQKQ